jgi:glycosyltransferase involved in cell wall biosynthesis
MLKEYRALKNAGYDVKVLYAFWASWAQESDHELFAKGKIDIDDFILVGGDPENTPFLYFSSRVGFKVIRLLSKIIPSSSLKELSINRPSFSMNMIAKGIKADLYIAHAIGVLPAVIYASKRNGGKVGIDFEDHYSGQWLEGSDNYYFYNSIEKKYLPKLDFSIASSNLIAEKYKSAYQFLNPVVIHNVFSRKHLISTPIYFNRDNNLKLFWFSQTVGQGRGLEEILRAMGLCNSSITLTILGSCSLLVKDELIQIALKSGLKKKQIIFLDPVGPDEIFLIAAEHHIGLALESENTINRNICLTNKLFSYMMAGLAIIASDTYAQKFFLDNNKGIGNYYHKGDIGELACLLKGYQSNPEILKAHRANSLKLASEKFNWEEEEEKLLSLIEKQFS